MQPDNGARPDQPENRAGALWGERKTAPVQVVRALAAMQAQEFGPAKWSAPGSALSPSSTADPIPCFAAQTASGFKVGFSRALTTPAARHMLGLAATEVSLTYSPSLDAHASL